MGEQGIGERRERDIRLVSRNSRNSGPLTNSVVSGGKKGVNGLTSFLAATETLFTFH